MSVAVRHPMLLGRTVDAIAQKLDFLQSRLNLDGAELKRIVLKQPSALSYSIDNNLAPTIDWLKANFSLTEAELKTLVLRFPIVLGYSIDDNLAPTLSWLTSRLLLTNAQLKTLILGLPPVLGLSVDANLSPTIDFFEHELNIRGSDLRELILTMPARLAYSLSKRYRPRLAACRAVGADLRLVLTCADHTDEQFCKRRGLTLEDYERLKSRGAVDESTCSGSVSLSVG